MCCKVVGEVVGWLVVLCVVCRRCLGGSRRQYVPMVIP